MKKWKVKKAIALLLVLVLSLSLTACTGSKTSDDNNVSLKDKIVNIGMSDTLSSVNPLLMDATEVLKYAMAFQFLPLVELNKDLEFEGMLASSVMTEDNIHFTVKIDEAATWSDGVPVTAHDVAFTVLKLASPTLANASMALYVFDGIGDDGFVKEGATSIDGIQVIDDKTIEFTTKYEIALTTFQNTYGRYILTLPKHILENVPEEELASYPWFQAPTVVNGPYQMTAFDLQHYVSYVANEAYWRGNPNIDKLNIKILTPSSLLTSLQSGEIDFVQQTTAGILQEDYESIENLQNVTVNYGAPVTNQSIFFNTTSVTDARIRQAILYGIDRETIVSGFLNGKGEVVDGFLSSASPFYDESLTPTAYNPKKAKELVEAAIADGYDASKVLQFYVNSGDATFTQAADFITAKLAEVGILVQVNTVDLSTLMSVAGNKEFDLLAVQYTYAPVDPYPDINWLLSSGGWTGYENDVVTKALAATQVTSDIEETRRQYAIINQVAQEEVPMISAYVISAIGAVNNRVMNAMPDVYGSFINVEKWDVTE